MSNHFSRKDAAALALVLTVASKACPKADNGEMHKDSSADYVRPVRWIPCDETPPQVPCLAIDNPKHNNIPRVIRGYGAVTDKHGTWYIDPELAFDESLFIYENRYFYWMPLPELPKEEVQL